MLTLFFRSLVFNIFIYIWSFIFAVTFLPFLVLPLEYLSKMPSIWTGPVLWCARFVVGMKFEVIDVHNISKFPAIYASNHQSAWEVFAFPFLIDSASAIIKKEMMYFPIMGWFFKKFKMIPIDRTAAKKGNWLEDAHNAFTNGRSIFIFPEGTRVAVGGDVDFKNGIYRLYEKLQCPVVPVALNSGVFWPRKGFIKKPGIVKIKFLPHIMPGLQKEEFMRILSTNIKNEMKLLLEKSHMEAK